MKKLNLYLFLLLCQTGMMAQHPFESVLNQVMENNISIRSGLARQKADLADLSTRFNLSDPEAEYKYEWGEKSDISAQTEFSLVQQFQLPGVYQRRRHYKIAEGNVISSRYDEAMSELKLKVSQTCIDLIYLREKIGIENMNVEILERCLKKSKDAYNHGNITRIDLNKVSIMLSESKIGLASAKNGYECCLKDLETLNGGKPVNFDIDSYPSLPMPVGDLDSIVEEYRNLSPSFRTRNMEVKSASELSRLEKAESLPNLHFGYQRNTVGKERVGGIVAGATIPLFSSKGKVKAAKARELCQIYDAEEAQLKDEMELRSLYSRMQTLSEILSDYEPEILDEQLELLGIGYEHGKLNAHEYASEVESIMDIRRDMADRRMEYEKICYELIRYRF